MSKQNLVVGAIILSITSLITRMLGFAFRVFLAGKIGAEGMGLYQLTFSLYLIFIYMCTSGVSVSITKLISEHIAKHGENGISIIIRKAVILTASIGCVLCVFLLAFSNPISEMILRDSRAALSLKFLAPTLPFIAISSCLNGYFYAVRNVVKPALTQLIEQISKIAFVAAILLFIKPDNVTVACAATVVGMGFGEIICCAVIGVGYLLEKQGKLKEYDNPPTRVLRQMLAVSIPISASHTATSCFRMLENILIVDKLKVHGSTHSQATGTYGILKGMVLPLLLFPSSLLAAFVTTLVPEVARANAGGNKRRVSALISRVLQITTILSILIVAIFLCFSYELGTLVYHSEEAGSMLGMLAILCPFMYLEMVVVGILNALGQQISSLRYNLMDSLLRITLIVIFIPKAGINAFLWVMVVSNLFTSLLNIRRLLKVSAVSFRMMDWLIKPSFAALGVGMLVKLFCRTILNPIMPLWASVVCGIVIIAGIYFILLFLLQCLKRRDLRMFFGYFKINKKAANN